MCSLRLKINKMIPVTVWGLTQPKYNKTFSKIMSENLTLPYVISAVKDDNTLITARTVIKIQKQIIASNCSPNVQVIVIDETDLQSLDTDLFTSAFNNLAHLSYYSSKTYVIYCSLISELCVNDEVRELHKKVCQDLRRLTIHWPGRCYFQDFEYLISRHDWDSTEVTQLLDSGQEKLAKVLVKVINNTPKEVFA